MEKEKIRRKQRGREDWEGVNKREGERRDDIHMKEVKQYSNFRDSRKVVDNIRKSISIRITIFSSRVMTSVAK